MEHYLILTNDFLAVKCKGGGLTKMSTIEKALMLLEHFSRERPEIGLTEFKTRTSIDKGTLHRHLTALKNSGFLEQNYLTKAYRLGPAVIRLAAVRENTVPIVKTVQYYVDRIADNIHELVHAALPQKNGMSAIYAKDGGYHGVRVNFDEAEILPFHATSSGLALLAFHDDTLVANVLSKKLVSFTDSTPTDAADIKANLETIRTHGFAFTDQSYEDEVGSVAVPFFGVKGDAIGTLAIAIPVSRINKSFHEIIIKQLIVASTELCRDLGGQIPTNVATIWAAKLEV